MERNSYQSSSKEYQQNFPLDKFKIWLDQIFQQFIYIKNNNLNIDNYSNCNKVKLLNKIRFLDGLIIFFKLLKKYYSFLFQYLAKNVLQFIIGPKLAKVCLHNSITHSIETNQKYVIFQQNSLHKLWYQLYQKYKKKLEKSQDQNPKILKNNFDQKIEKKFRKIYEKKFKKIIIKKKLKKNFEKIYNKKIRKIIEKIIEKICRQNIKEKFIIN
ncbi:hypothetical protein pb186bvf_016506 [Paramecium bursaria]